jgi:hypothetical protein
MMYSQLQNSFAEGLFGVLPLLLVWVAIFLLLARKKQAAGILFGIAVVWHSTQAAVHYFYANQLGSAAMWASIAIAGLIGVTLILKEPVGTSVKSESE